LLGEAGRVYHQPAVAAAILDRARADATRIMADAPPADPGDGLSLWLEMDQP
jgi:uroporphyrin-III C-methyltransferase/precorrin-2 dehydrogenase/sirohydrochlorin ferrochelatase